MIELDQVYNGELTREEKAAALLALSYELLSEVAQTELISFGPFVAAPVNDRTRAQAIDVAACIASIFPHELKIATAAGCEPAAAVNAADRAKRQAYAGAVITDYDGSVRRIGASTQWIRRRFGGCE